MNPARPVFSIVSPPLLWLLLGAPGLSLTGNQCLLGALLLHLYAVIWQDALFALCRGDGFTYRMFTRGLNLMLFVASFVSTASVIWLHGGRVVSPLDLHPVVAGIIGVSLLLSMTMPLLVSRVESPLPTPSARRAYEDPSDRR